MHGTSWAVGPMRPAEAIAIGPGTSWALNWAVMGFKNSKNGLAKKELKLGLKLSPKRHGPQAKFKWAQAQSKKQEE